MTSPSLNIDFSDGRVIQRRPTGGNLSFVLHEVPPTAEVRVAVTTAEGLPVAARIVQNPGVVVTSRLVTLGNLPPGGPFYLKVTSPDRSPVERTFWVGDLWLMAGQSNMEGVGLMAEAPVPHPQVRNFTLARRWTQAEDPLHFLAESPDAVHHLGRPCPADEVSAAKRAALRGVGVGIPFGRLMVEETGVPQGLISAAHGGSSMADWSPEKASLGPDSLYGSMLQSLKAVDQPLAGVLWFQGCSDTNDGDADRYTQRMIELVAAVRADLGQPELPWLTVQIGVEVGRTVQTQAWHRIQEHQRRLPEHIPHLGVCASADLEHDDWIHLSARAFPELARRLVNLVRNQPQPGPVRARWAPDGVSPAIEIDGAPGTELHSQGLPRGFVLVDTEARPRDLIYQVRFDGSKVRLRLTDDDMTGLSVHHGWGAQPEINTYDAQGMPLPVFGPLAIEGLPPVSAWFRSWHISPPLPSDLRQISVLQAPTEGPRRRFEGWNVIALKDEWKDSDQCRAATTWVQVPEAMDVEILVGGDGPLRVWFEAREVITDHEGSLVLATVRSSGPLKAEAGRHCVQVAMNNRHGEAYGFSLRLRRIGVVDNPVLPFEV